MSYILRIIAPSDGSYKISRSFYVESFEERLHISTHKKEARRFDTAAEALEWWREKDVKKAYRIEVLENK